MGFPKDHFKDCTKFPEITDERLKQILAALDYSTLEGEVSDSDFLGLLSKIHRLEKERANIIEDVYWEMDWRGNKPDGTRLFPEKPEKEMMFDESKALATLLNKEVIFLNNHWWMKDWPEEAQKKFSINCNCNDIFAWACADAEGVNYDELKDLYDHYVKDPSWGSAVWCIKKRKMMPQRPVRQSIEKAGIWDLSSMGLSDNPE